jgi:hypothetical protein
MPHIGIIVDSFRAMLMSAEVRDHLTPGQCTKVDQILQCPTWTDEQFRYLARRVTGAYCQED